MFTGLSAFPITPRSPDGSLDRAALARLLDRMVAAGVQSVGLLGSTGGYMYLTPAERGAVLRAAVDHLDGRLPLIVGVGALTTAEAVALARDAAEAGADGLLLAPVTYTPLTEAEVEAHCHAVAEATDLPLCLYNNPGTTHFTFSHALIGRLAQHPRIAAVKMPLPADGDFAGEIAALRALCPQDFRIGYSGDWGLAPAMAAGSDAFYSVIGGLLPAQTLALARAAQAGDPRGDAAFAPMWDLFRAYGSLRIMHEAAGMLGLATPSLPLPLRPVPEALHPRIGEALAALGAA